MIILPKKKIEDEGFSKDANDFLSSEKLFRMSLDDLESRVRKLRNDFPEGVTCSDVPTCREAELMVELHRSEHDNAGAYKFKRFARETLDLFESDKIKLDEENGKCLLNPELEQRRYLFVSMGELDRLNKEGHSHEAGDVGLRALVKAIDETCEKYLGRRAVDKKIFRYGGNEYCVEFDDISPEELFAIENAITSAVLDMGDDYKQIEPPPVSVYTMNFAEAIEILNDTSRSFDKNVAGYKTLSIVRREANYNLEIKKFITRVERAIEKLKTAKTKGEAKDFFNNYLKKGFYGSGIESLDDIEFLIKGKDPDELKHKIELMAEDAVKNKFANDREMEMYEDHVVDTRHNEIVRGAEPDEDITHTDSGFDTDKKIAVIPRVTRGQAILADKRMKMLGRTGVKRDRIKELEYFIEVAKRDEGTGLLERGQFYDDWIDQVKAVEKTGDGAAIVFVDMGFLKYFDNAGGRLVGDAALRKAAELMEKAIEKSGVNAFAYRYSGDEFAIRVNGGREDAQKVTDALYNLRADAGKIPDLAGLREQQGDKDVVGDSRADYAPTELVFNIGIAEIRDFYTIINDLRETGDWEKVMVARGLTESELLSELVVKLADTSVNYEKAVSRFRLLIELMRNPAYRDASSSYDIRVESIIKYSQKAILANLGGDAALRVFADSAIEDAVIPSHLNEQIERFVADRLEKVKKIAAEERSFVDRLIEIHAVRSRLIEQIEGLKMALLEQSGALTHEHDRVLELQAKLTEAETVRQELIEARSMVSRQVLDKKAKIG